MLTKGDINSIKALSKSAERKTKGCFVAEGVKLVRDMLGHFICDILILSEELYPLLEDYIDNLPEEYKPYRLELVVNSFDFNRISTQRTPQPVLAVFRQPIVSSDDLAHYPKLMLLLDEVQDPGNVGTILRTANWFGVEYVLLTEGCADVYSPKVVQATMGALSQVRTSRLLDATKFLSEYKGRVCGTFLSGDDLYRSSSVPRLTDPALLIMGNEGRGIRESLLPFIDTKLYIPSGRVDVACESLNVAVATAVCLSEFSRPQ